MKRPVAMVAALALAASGAAEPVVLKFNSPAPPRSFLHEGAFTPWAKAVSEASGGTLKVDMYFGGTLGNFGVTYDRVLDGVADIGFILTALAGGKFRQEDVAALPFESKSSLGAATVNVVVTYAGATPINVAGIVPDARHAPALETVLTRELTLDLFAPPSASRSAPRRWA